MATIKLDNGDTLKWDTRVESGKIISPPAGIRDCFFNGEPISDDEGRALYADIKSRYRL